MLLFIAVSSTYFNSLHVPFVMDDFVIYNFGPQNLLDILFHGGQRRFVDFTLAVNYHLHGTDYTGYHLVNIAIHLLASVTLYFLIASCFSALKLTFPLGSRDSNSFHFVEQFVPFATALLFAVHPIQTQAVTYIIQRYASMATLFYLLAAFFYVKARINIETHRSATKTSLLATAVTLSALVAFGSKQITFTLPLMLIVIEILLFKGKLLTRKVLLIAGIFGGVLLSLSLFNWHDSSLDDILFDLRQNTAEDRYISRTSYFLTECRVLITYLRLLILPINQSIFYDYPIYTTLFSFPVATSVTAHVLIISLMAFALRKSRRLLQHVNITHGILLRLMALGICWFYLAMAVESSIFPIRDVIFEHRVYLPSIGFFLAASTGIAITADCQLIPKISMWVLLTILTLVLGSMTIARNNLWNDTLELWKDTVNKAPKQHLALSNLAIEHLERKNPVAAIPLFVRALELRPQMDFRIKVYFGEALQESNLFDKSRFTTGMEYMQPDYTSSSYKSASVMFNNLGLAYEYMELPEKAVIAYTKALRINPTYDLAWYNLGLLSARIGDRNQVAKAIRQLEDLQPQLAKILVTKTK